MCVVAKSTGWLNETALVCDFEAGMLEFVSGTMQKFDNVKNIFVAGVDPGFSLGGGGGVQKIICTHADHEHEARSPLWLGS